MKKIRFLLLSLCMLVGCKEESSSRKNSLNEFKFSEEEYITEEMGAFWIEDELEIEPEELKDAVLEDIVWTSEDESIVKVSNGRAFGLYEGENHHNGHCAKLQQSRFVPCKGKICSHNQF